MAQIISTHSENYLNQLPEGPYDEMVEDCFQDKLREKGTVINGKRNGPFSRYNDHHLLEKGSYKDGKQHGTITTYWKDGTISHIDNWKNGKQSGEFSSYYLSGKVRQKGEWHDAENGQWCECYTEDKILLSRVEQGKDVFRHENEEELDPGAPYE